MFLNRQKTLVYNFSSLGLIQVTNFLLSLVVIPFVIKKVGADGFGVVAVAQVLIFYLYVITDYGFNRTATREIALYRDDREKVSKIFSTVLISKALLSVVSFLLLILLVLSVPLFRQHSLLYLLAFSFVLGQVFLINWFFQGFEKMQYIALFGLFSRIIFTGLVFIFIREKADNAYYIFFMGLGNIIAGFLSIYVAIRMYRLKFVMPTGKDILLECKGGWPITVTNLSQVTCQYIGIFILRLFTNDLVVGYYSVAEKIYFGMKLMIEVFSQVVYPRVCQLMQEGKDQVIAFFKQFYVPFLLIVVICSAIVFGFSVPITRFFVGDDFTYTSFLLRVLCVATVIVTLNMPAQLVLLAGDHKRSYLKIFMIGTGLNILANFILANYFDATGTVIAVLVTELFITAGLYIEVDRVYRIKPVDKQTLL